MLNITDPTQITDPNTTIGYWNENPDERGNYLVDAMLRATPVSGEHVSMYYGASPNVEGLPQVPDNVSAPSKGGYGTFATDSFRLLNFKRELPLDERMRNEIDEARTLHANDPAFLNAVGKEVIQFNNSLIEDAHMQREKLFLDILLTGKLRTVDNKIFNEQDMHLPENHKIAAQQPWGNKDSHPIQDLKSAAQYISDDNNTSVNVALMNSNTFRSIVDSGEIRNTLSLNLQNSNAAFNDNQVYELIADNTPLRVMIYDKNAGKPYTGDNGQPVVDPQTGMPLTKKTKLIPDGKVVLLPEGAAQGGLGRLAYGQTNDQKFQMNTSDTQVANSGDGVTLKTYTSVEPNTLHTVVSEKMLPVIDAIQNYLILDAYDANESTGSDGNYSIMTQAEAQSQSNSGSSNSGSNSSGSKSSSSNSSSSSK